MAARCSPPRTVSVKGYWRNAGPKKRRKKRAASKPKTAYYVVENGHGGSCGHHHRTFTAAVQCRKRKDRSERAYRARHGGRRDVWTVEHRKP